MKYALATIALLASLTVAFAQEVPDKPAENSQTFEDEWNTLLVGKEGDWLEYQFENTVGRLRIDKARPGKWVWLVNDTRDGTPNKHYCSNSTVHDLQQKPQNMPPFWKWREWAIQGGKAVGATWNEESISIGNRELSCSVCRWGKDCEAWFSKDVPCGGMVKLIGNSKVVFWVSAFGDKATLPEGALRAPEESSTIQTPSTEPKAAQSYGDPLTMGLPDSIKEAIRDQGIAITRLGLLFDERGGKDGIALEFEGMRTEIPVVYAAFVGEKCDQELSYKDWSARTGHGVDVTFLVKTMPAKLDGLEVSVEHMHMKGSGETLQSTFKATDVELGKPYSVRLRGAQPGINHYRLVVSYKNAAGERTSQTGFSHWLIVAAPPMFEFASEPTCVATWHKAGKLTIIDAQATLNSSFMLHTGLSTADCEVRVMRRGSRDIKLSNLSPEVRRVVGDAGQTVGWQEVGRAKPGDKDAGWLKFTLDENGFVKLSCTHSLSVTSDVLPLNEAWEYRFELRHKSMREALATWTMNVALQIARPEDINKAKLILTATGMEKALEVALTQK